MLDTDEKIDRIYDKIDRLLYEGKFDVVDKILGNVTTKYLNSDFLITFLTVTLPAKSKLLNRPRLYHHTSYYILCCYGNDYKNKVLDGLK